MTSRAWGMAVTVAALLCAGVRGADAQVGPRHDGFTWSGGVGMGKLRTACTGCNEPARESAMLVTGRVGWTLADKIIVGGEIVAYQKQQQDNRGDEANTTYTGLTLSALVYPAARVEFFFKVGGGVALLAQSLDTPLGLRDLDATATSLRLGIGWDMRFGRRWSFTPFADFLLSPAVDTNVDGVQIKPSILIFGGAITFH